MSTGLVAKGPLHMTRFWGGDARGMSLQLTEVSGQSWRTRHVQIAVADIPALIADLQAVVDGTIGEEP